MKACGFCRAENSASNEEILSTIESENNDIITIKSSIQEIKEMTTVLSEMLKL